MKESTFSKVMRDDIYYLLTKEAVIKDGEVIKQRRVPHIYLIHDAYRSGKKPYDFYFVHGKSFYAIELKVQKGQSLVFDSVKPHQVESLYEVEHAGKCGKGYIVIYLNDFEDKRQALVFPVYKWAKLIKQYPNKKSIKIKELLEKHEKLVNIMHRKKIDGHVHWDIKEAIIYDDRY